MRVIGGKYKSRVLLAFEGTAIRPTSDRAKEALFNILALKIAGARALDLFCGSGALGIECLSRGASEVVFNDAAKDSVALLKKNLTKLGVGREAVVYTFDYLACLSMQKTPFDLIFLDPPYKEEYGKKALEQIAKEGLLSEQGIAVYERDRSFEGQISGLEIFDERKYGKTYFTFFRREQR
ncbi:MAG: 16S rRNA (guanine(966)-N(2))-methyltransferase RsmD [Clostridia bacterium]|nr:16S rRNA (guanine(966)-N(2))-methyltransferase RsmD [Clostridia bacterium]